MSIGCEDCKKCYNTCKDQFPEEYIDGGADKCNGFEQETDDTKVISNMEKKSIAIRDTYAEKGIFV